MTTYFKAVRPDGTDWRTGKVQWAPPPGHVGEWIVQHPTAAKIGFGGRRYLSVSTVVTDCTGMGWPCRLLTVEAAGDVTTPLPITLPNKRAGVTFRVTGELPAHEALGPQGVHVAALIERERHLTPDEASALHATWDAARGAVWDAAFTAARKAAWDAARGGAWDAASHTAWDVARGLVVRDLITTSRYDALTRPWRTVIGPIHPDDPDLRTTHD